MGAQGRAQARRSDENALGANRTGAMSFGDLYTVNPGQDVAPGLPPVDLPKIEGRPPLRVTVRKAAADDGAWGSSAQDFKPQQTPAAKQEDADGAWGASRADHSPETEKAAQTLHRDISGGEAFGRSAAAGATFGLAPALSGLTEAGIAGLPPAKDVEREPGAIEMMAGLYNLAKENILDPMFGTKDKTGPATEVYRKARDEAQAALEAGREQHPVISFAGELVGGAFTPLPGIAAG